MKQYFPDLPYWCKYYEIDGRISFPVKKNGKLTGKSIIYLNTRFSRGGTIFKYAFEIDELLPRLDEVEAALKSFHAELKSKTGIDL